MSKTPTKIVKKKKEKKPWNTEIQRLEKKKDVQNFVFRYKETQSFKKQKYVWQYIQKKNRTKIWRLFSSHIKIQVIEVFSQMSCLGKKKKKEKKYKAKNHTNMMFSRNN